GLRRTVEEDVPLAVDVRVVLADDTIRWLHCRAKVTSWAGDRPAAVSGTVQDITERKEAEASLVDALSVLSATLDSTADGILVVDGRGTIVSYNQRFVELWRIPAEIIEARNDDARLAFVMGQ